MTPPPSHTLSPMTIGRAASHLSRRGPGSTGCVGGEELHVRPDLHVVADGHGRDVEAHQAEVGERARTDERLVPVVAAERRPDLAALAERAEQLGTGPARRSAGRRC